MTYYKYNRIYLLHTYIRPWRVYMGWVWFYLSSWVKISWNLFWQIQIQLKSVLCKRRELVREKMINMWWTFFDVWWGLNWFWRNFYAVETAWRVQRNSNIISKEIPEAFYVFIIFAQWQHFLVNFFWNSDAFLLHVHWNSSEFLLLLLHFCLQFLCISDFLKEFLMNFLCMSYAFLMNFLRISYAILMHFLCNSYAVFTTSYVLGKSVCSFGKSVWSF